jgi:hypothetical protein
MLKTKLELNLKDLYENDFNYWLETTVNLLEKKAFSQLDLDNLIEEIKAMSRSEKRALKNRLTVLIMHLLKWKYQPSKISPSWKKTILEQRRRIEYILEDSPSLKAYLLEIFPRCYQKARQDASEETNLKLTTFPEEIPFTLTQILMPNFYPKS